MAVERKHQLALPVLEPLNLATGRHLDQVQGSFNLRQARYIDLSQALNLGGDQHLPVGVAVPENGL